MRICLTFMYVGNRALQTCSVCCLHDDLVKFVNAQILGRMNHVSCHNFENEKMIFLKQVRTKDFPEKQKGGFVLTKKRRIVLSGGICLLGQPLTGQVWTVLDPDFLRYFSHSGSMSLYFANGRSKSASFEGLGYSPNPLNNWKIIISHSMLL